MQNFAFWPQNLRFFFAKNRGDGLERWISDPIPFIKVRPLTVIKIRPLTAEMNFYLGYKSYQEKQKIVLISLDAVSLHLPDFEPGHPKSRPSSPA